MIAPDPRLSDLFLPPEMTVKYIYVRTPLGEFFHSLFVTISKIMRMKRPVL